MGSQQLEIVQTIEAMFKAAPGAHFLSEFTAFVNNSGSIKDLANALAQTDVFKQSLYSDALSNQAFATQFVENTVGSLVSVANKAWAASEIEGLLNAGQGRGEVIHWAATALASVDVNDVHWGAAAQQFNNKVEVAAFYSIDQGGSATSLAVLQQVTAHVTDDIATVASAKALLESGVTGKVIDGYVKGATVFADLNGDGVHNADESGAITDAFGNFSLPGVTGFGQLIVSGGTDISTGKPFEGNMTAPVGSTVINPLTTLIDKITQNSTTTVEEATAKLLTSLGLNTNVDLLNFDPIQETIRTDTDATATGIALAIHTAAVKINTLISQAAALLNGAGVSANENAAIDLAYETLAVSLASKTSAVDLTSSSVIAQVIQDATVNSGADNTVLFKVGALLPDASQAISNLNQAITDAVTSSSNKSSVLSSIAAVQIVAENIEATMQSGAAAGSVGSTVTSTTGSTLTSAITTAGAIVGDVTGDGIPDTPPPPSSGGGGGGGGSPAPSTVQSFLATSATAFTGTSANDVLSVSTAATFSPLVMTTVILDGGTGTNTLSVQDGSNIAAAIVLNFPNLTFDATGVTLTNDVTLSASQNQLFTGTITAAGTGANGEKITIVGDGAVTTLAGVEEYSVGDDSTNARTVTVSNANTKVTANSATDAVTFNLGTLAYTGAITGDGTADDTLSLSTGADISGGTITGVEALTLASGASVTMTQAQYVSFTGTKTAPGTGVSGEKIKITGNGAVTALSNIETYELGDDTTNARAVTTNSVALNLIANNAGDTITVNAAALAENSALTVAAASASNLTVAGLVGDLVATNLSGDLTITTANAADNGISITTGSAKTSVNVAVGAASDTVSINAAALANNIALTITSGGAAAGIVNITNLAGDLIVSNPTSGTIGVAVTDNTVDNGIAITAAAANLAITGVADGDTVTVTGFTGSILTGAIAGTTGKFNITTSAGTSDIATAAGNDIFSFAADTGLTSADKVDGGAGTDTLTLTGNAIIDSSDFTNVKNIEAITVANTTTNVTITTADQLVAGVGVALTFNASTLTTGILTFNGSNETSNAFNITAGTATALGDSIIGGPGDDTITFTAGKLNSADTVNGGIGTDTLALTGNVAVTSSNFDNVSNVEVITLANTSTNVAITTVETLVATGATLTLNASSLTTGVLTFNGSAETDGVFNITSGGGADSFAFVGGTSTGLTTDHTIDGGAGTDTVTLTGNADFTASNDFDKVKNIEAITLSGRTTGAVTITTKDTLVAAGATLTLSNAANSGALTFKGDAETNGSFSITGGSGNDGITGGKGNDTFTFVGGTGLTKNDTVDGGAGTDTIALSGNTVFTAVDDFDNVKNIEIITFTGRTTGAVTITTKDSLVAAGITLMVNASTLTTGALTFDGSAETNGVFNITSGGGADIITGGLGNDVIAGGNGTNNITPGLGNDSVTGGTGADTFTFAAVTGLTSADTVDGSTGTDTVVLTGDTAFMAANDFDNIKNIESITFTGRTTGAINITTKDTLVAAGATLTLTNAANSGALTFIGSAETDGVFNITGGTGNDSITGGAGNDTLAGGTGDDTLTGGAGNDTITSGAGNDSITGGAGADTITLGNSANDNTRQMVIYSSAADGAAAGANSGADTITSFDANVNDATDDLIQIAGTLKTAVNDDGDGNLDYSTSDGADLGNQIIAGSADQEATILFDAEVELVLADFTTFGLVNVLTELEEEIDFTSIATGEEHLFLINFSATQTALVLYTAGTGGDDTIIANDIQVLGSIMTHNDGTGLVAGNMTF